MLHHTSNIFQINNMSKAMEHSPVHTHTQGLTHSHVHIHTQMCFMTRENTQPPLKKNPPCVSLARLRKRGRRRALGITIRGREGKRKNVTLIRNLYYLKILKLQGRGGEEWGVLTSGGRCRCFWNSPRPAVGMFSHCMRRRGQQHDWLPPRRVT